MLDGGYEGGMAVVVNAIPVSRSMLMYVPVGSKNWWILSARTSAAVTLNPKLISS